MPTNMDSAQSTPASASRPRADSPWTARRVALYLLSISPVLLLIALFAWGQFRSGGNPSNLLVNSTPGEQTVTQRLAPSFELVSLRDGDTVTPESLRGQVVMIDFWSSWCAPCRAEAPTLAQVYREFEGQPVEFVGVAIWDESGDIMRHIDRYGVGYVNVIDARGKTTVDYGVGGIPEKFFLDRNGNIVKKFIGPISEERLREILHELLATS